VNSKLPGVDKVEGVRFSIPVHRRLELLDLIQWDSLQPDGGFYSSSPWLRHAERTADRPPFYFTAVDGDRLCAAMPAYPLSLEAPFTFCRPDHVIDRISVEATGLPTGWSKQLMPGLACGARNPSHSGIAAADDLDMRTQRAMYEAVVEKAERVARDDALKSVAFLYVDATDDGLRAVLEQAGYAALHCETTYSLTLPPSEDFAGYLARLRTHRRGGVRRDMRALEAAGVTYRVRSLSDDLVGQLAPLEAQLYDRHGTVGDEASLRAVLHSISNNVAGHSEIVTAEVDGQLGGFVLIFTHGHGLYARQAGFDYSVKGSLPLYFGLIFYELVRLAQSRGLSAIHYSIGAGEVKESRGCAGVEQIAYVKSFAPQIQRRVLDLAQLSPPRS